LGTGLIEAFSTPCTYCGGRGILLHGDPVDSTSTTGRKSETGGRRGKRGKKGGKGDEVAVAKVPDHPAGEHPMFKAMAAANGRHEDEDEDEDQKAAGEVAELEPDVIREAFVEAEDDELEDDDFDEEESDEDEDESDEDEIDLDADDEDDDIDDDIEVINDDTDDEDYDEDESDEDDSENDDSENDDDLEAEPPVVTAPAGRHRRRAAARPAGPPIHEG
jgi:ribonuclease E